MSEKIKAELDFYLRELRESNERYKLHANRVLDRLLEKADDLDKRFDDIMKEEKTR